MRVGWWLATWESGLLQRPESPDPCTFDGTNALLVPFADKTVVEQPHIETHAPVMRMQCQSKISCLSWNPYVLQE